MPAMKRFTPALLVLLLGAVSAVPQINLARYFPSAAAEAASRARLMADARDFERTDAAPIRTADDLRRWIERYDALLEAVERHDVYVYLRSEENDADVADAQADSTLGDLEGAVSAHFNDVVAAVGTAKIERFLRSDARLALYRYLLESSRAKPAAARIAAKVAEPTIESMGAAYTALRKRAIAAQPNEKWAPFAQHEDAFAAMLIAIASARNGSARVSGYPSAVEAAYASRSLQPESVERTLAAVRASNAYAQYHAMLASDVAKHAAVFEPPHVAIDEAIQLVLAATQPMGQEYAAAYRALLDPKNERFELCMGTACADDGFSVGFAGMESGVFIGGYDGSIKRVKVIAHEAGHAVHREFMAAHQPIAAYNSGPNWMFESFAIFNELLFYDSLYRKATTNAERAYYLNLFVDDATFQVFGSAEETDLEAGVYRGVAAGRIRSAADLDALTMRTFERYDPTAATTPEIRNYWARDRLYFTDPLYDVNYLYAGLLALRYFDMYERDPRRFSKHYVALLGNGFNDSSAVLERKFLGIDLGDTAGLVRNASALVARRTALLEKLYASSSS